MSAFLALNISMAMVWYFSSDDPASENYLPPDWPHLVAANLGLGSATAAAPQLIGLWQEVDGGDTVSFGERGQYSSTHQAPGSDLVISQSQGQVLAAQDDYVTVKVTSTERIKIDNQPVSTPDGYFVRLNGKLFKRVSASASRL
jgi:hypothetical protein